MTFEKKTDLLNVLFIKPQSEHLFVEFTLCLGIA